MCGIVGILALGGESTVDRDLLCRMRDTSRVMGPQSIASCRLEVAALVEVWIGVRAGK